MSEEVVNPENSEAAEGAPAMGAEAATSEPSVEPDGASKGFLHERRSCEP